MKKHKMKEQPKKRSSLITKAEVVAPKGKTLLDLLRANRHLAQKARIGLS
jgi:hypothetical protein